MSTIITHGTCINMTRGDTPTFEVVPPFTPAAGSKIIFRLKKSPYIDGEPLVEKELVGTEWTMDVDDTASLAFGDYRYSLEYVLGGYHDTIVPPTIMEGLFHIGEENENHA